MKLYITADDFKFARVIHAASKEGLSLELRMFAHPSFFTDSDMEKRIEAYKHDLADFSGKLSIHAPYYAEICPFSADKDIRKISLARYNQTISLAETFGADRVIFHLNYLPMLKSTQYDDFFVKVNGELFSKLLQEHSHTKILIENMWEPQPDILKSVIDEVNDQRLKMCFDTGHFNVYARSDLDAWFDVVGKDIDYIHLHNNKGIEDTHSLLEEGTFPILRFLDYWTHKIIPDINIEIKAPLKTILSEVTLLRKEYMIKDDAYEY
jgi:sugar phosphate isomerase/epimerase